VAQDKVALFASLIPHIDKFNDVLEYKASLFLVLPKVIQLLVPLSCAKILILQHFKTFFLIGLQNSRKSFLQPGENDAESANKVLTFYSSLV
jgi:hypothetical protein